MKNPVRPKEGATYRYDPIGWDRFVPKPFAGGTPIAPGARVTVIGGVGGRFGGKRGPMAGTLKFVWVRDESGQEQSISPKSLVHERDWERVKRDPNRLYPAPNPHRSYSVWQAGDDEWTVAYGRGTFQDSLDVAVLTDTTEERAVAAAEALNASGRDTSYQHAASWLKSHGWPTAEAVAGLERTRIEEVEKNPYSSEATYWHFRVLDPKRFVRFRTIDPGHPGGAKLVVGYTKQGRSEVQKIMVPKADYPSAEAARGHARDLLDRNMWNRVLKGNPPDDEMPLIYGRTHKITMTKTNGSYRGQKFFHRFGAKVTQHGLPEGTRLLLPSGRTVDLPLKTVLLRGPKGLWGRYA